MVSEDSDQLRSGLLAVHRLGDFCEFRKTLMSLMLTSIDHPNAAREVFEVTPLRCMQWVRFKERNDRVDQIRPPSYSIAIQVFLMVIVTSVGKYPSDSEKLNKVTEAREALRPLRHRELMRHLIAGFVASAIRSIWLSNKADGEATLSVYKTNYPAELNQSFLLIVCTRHIFTVPPT